ncbi:MAG TPA: AMP-binding protein, partial [Actinomycetota bacterium]|nr:AMP-binding protein [Actinomycetota bacterium]
MGDVELQSIEALLEERRVIEPPESFHADALVRDDSIYREAADDLEGFWAREGERIDWFEKWDRLLEWDPPWQKWFVGGKLNVAHNCVDRHVEAGLGDRVAYHWEGEPGDQETITYERLRRDVVRTANVLKSLGVRKGTPVGIYMGMIPRLPVAMLACARLGAPHTVVFGGFSAEALSDRLNDMGCEVLITQDEGWRRGQRVPLKRNADAALESAPGVKHVLVARRTGGD